MAKEFAHGCTLLVGVGACKIANLSLSATVADARTLRGALTDPQLCAYVDDAEHVRSLSEDTATRQNIIDGLEWLASRAAKDSEATIVVYFSGHGLVTKPSGSYVLVTHDFDWAAPTSTGIEAAEFTKALRSIPARRLLVFLDCCHAEGMATSKDYAAAALPSGFAKAAVPTDVLQALKEGEGRAVFTSCRGEQQSYLRADRKLSIFTDHLVEALRARWREPSSRGGS